MVSVRVLSGQAAGKHLAEFGSVTPGTCLNVVWQAFGSPVSTDGAKYGGYGVALEAYRSARDKGAIRGTRLEDAPDGAVLYWSNVWGTWKGYGWSDAGHIAIKGRGDTINTIDLPTRGRAGVVTIAQFKAAWSWLKFEGWASGEGAFLGHTVKTASMLPEPVTPATAGGKKGDDVPNHGTSVNKKIKLTAKPGVWQTAPIRDKRGNRYDLVSAGVGAKRVTGEFSLRVVGLAAGQSFNARAVVVNKNGKTVAGFGPVVVHGKSGASYASVPFTGDVGKGNLLRLQVDVAVQGVTIEEVRGRVFEWVL